MKIINKQPVIKLITKNRSIFLVFLICNYSFICAQIDDNIKEDLHGNVKSIRVTIKFVKDSVQNLKLLSNDNDYGHTGFLSPVAVKSNFESIWYETTGTRYLNYYQERDKKNRITKELWLNKKDELVEDYRYLFNNNGLKSDEHISDFEKNVIVGENCDFNKYHYENDLLVKRTERNKCLKSEYFTTYTYNRNKRLVNKFRYFSYSDGDIDIDGELYHYQDSLLIKITPYSDSNSLHDQGYEHVYDYKNRLIEIYQLLYYKWIKANDTLKRKYSTYPLKKLYRKKEYDQNDNIIKEIFYNDYEKNNDSIKLFKIEKTKYKDDLEIENSTTGYFYSNGTSTSLIKKTYDKNERLECYQRFRDGELQLTRTYSYNNKNNIVSLVLENQDGRFIENGKIVYSYTYDSEGNWIKQTKSINGEPYYIWYRNIEYYK